MKHQSSSTLPVIHKPEVCVIKTPTVWDKRTRLEKWLILAIGASFLIIVASNSVMMMAGRKMLNLLADESNSVNDVCLSPGCVKAASHILESMDTKVSPCTDFYEFACGGWKKSKHINEDQSGITEFGALREDLNRKLRKLIETESKADEPIYNHMMRLMYRQCMNLSKIEAYQADLLVSDIIEVGGWPVIEGPKWNERSFDWITTILKFRKMGFNHNIFLALFVGPDVRNSTRHVAQIDQGSLGVPNRKYLMKGLNDSVVKEYYEMMIESAMILGSTISKTDVEKDMMDVLLFETKLSNITLAMEDRRNFTKLYNKMTLSQVMDLAPGIDWRRMVDNVFLDPIGDSEEFIVKVPNYISELDKLLSSTRPRIIANYLIFRMVYSTFPQLGKRWRSLTEKYDKALTGKGAERPRWDTCMRRLYGSFGVPMSAVYVRHHFDSDSLFKAKEMVGFIHKEFIKILEGVEWMDRETKRKAIEKAKAITTRIGYSTEIMQHEKVMELFHGLTLSENATFYENVQILRKYWTDYDMKKLRKPYDKNDWKKFSQAATINAFYNSLENSIKFPAGILQGIFFDSKRPMYLNYGAIGYIIGHEITHGFDDRGRQFDKDGNNRNWWKTETDKKFQEKAKCIVDQYNNFVIPGEKDLRLNGVNTQGENIADNGGLKQAFLGYQEYIRENNPEQRLPGLNYTPNQLFWISSANIWCAKIRSQSLKLRIQTGVHSPPRFRVIGPMVNLAQFSESFNCPLGSPMNPVKKCSLW